MGLAGLPRPATRFARFMEGPLLAPLRNRRRWLTVVGLGLLAVFIAGIWFVGQNWPFRYRKMKPLLENVFGCQIQVAQYHRIYFPSPGFVATNLTLRRKSAPHQPRSAPCGNSGCRAAGSTFSC